MSAPRVLHVVESWRPVASGYASRSWRIVEGQARNRVSRPSVLVTSRQQVYGFAAAEPLDSVPIRLCPQTAWERSRRRLRAFAIDEDALTTAIIGAAREVDLIHVHWSSGIGSAAAQAADRLGLPLVAEVRFDLAGAMAVETLRGMAPFVEAPLRKRFERHLGRARCVVAASESLARLLERSFPGVSDRLTVVPNGVTEQPSAGAGRLREKLQLEGRFVLGTTSKMLRYENLSALLRTAKDIPSGHALFVGDGPQRSALQGEASRSGMPATFTGRVDASEIGEHLAAMDVFVVPRLAATITRFAGPIKVVEAMAAGLPVVATAVGDLPYLLADGRGVLVEPGDQAGLTRAVRELADLPEKRNALGAAAAEWAKRELDWDRLVSRYAGVYQEALR